MNKKQQIIKLKSINDFDIIKGIASFKKDEEYEFTYDEEIDKYMVAFENIFINFGFPKSYIDKHFYTEKEMPLREKYAKELAEVERLFPEGTEGRFFSPINDEISTCIRRGSLNIDYIDYAEGNVEFIRIYSPNGYGLLWSSKHGYSTSNVKEKTPLEICKEKYKEGTKIRSLGGSVVVLSENNVKKLYCNRGDVYTNHGDYQLYSPIADNYAEILEEPMEIEFEGFNDSMPNKPTFGEKLVGGSVPTPASKLKADRLKSLFAEITDIVNEHSEEMPTDILNKDFGMIQSSIYLSCLTDILKAQMLSVKFVTLQKD